jgi:hypothetical protein
MVSAKLLLLLPFKDLGSATAQGNDEINVSNVPKVAMEGA